MKKTYSKAIFIIFLILIINLFSPRKLLFAAENTKYKITRIFVSGNEKTKAFVILREMEISENDSVTIKQLESDQKKIQNLQLFNRVEIILHPVDDGYLLEVHVTERWYLFPYPIFFRNDKDWNKFSYGFGVFHQNFRGRKETLDFSGYLGYSKQIGLKYSIPWLIPKWQIYSALYLYSSHYKSKNLNLAQFTEVQNTAVFSVGKRFGLFAFLDFTGSYQNYKATDAEQPVTLSASGKDAWFSSAISFRYDNRDLHEFPRSGWYLKGYWQKSGRNGKIINYSHYGVDARRYIPLPLKTSLAMRSSVDLTRGRIPAYQHLYLGYSERVRGYFFDEFEGENRIMSGLEFRFPIRKITYHSFFQDTPAAQYYRNLKFGISGGIFIDTGTVWYQHETLTSDMLKTGYGVGLFFHLPYVEIARIEYAINRQNESEIILLDLGVAF